MAETPTATDTEGRFVSPGTLFVFAVFVISRFLYWRAGLRFDASPVRNFWQYIDPFLMKTKLLQSLYYLHMQPPGFNLVIGLVVKLFPDSYATVLWIIYLILGISIALSLLYLMRLFHVAESVALVLTALFVVNPGCVLYENIATYEYPIALLLLLAAVALNRLCRSPSLRRSLMFFAILFSLSMIRNIFHILFVLLIAVMLAIVLPKARRIVLAGALPVLVLILALQTKNWILFRSFTTSTWAGMNTGVVTTFQLTPEEARQLVHRGVLSPIAEIPPFSELKDYAPFIRPVAPTGIPVLDQADAAGHPNFNDVAYLQVGDLYIANAKAIWRHYPVAYARSVAIAWFTYFLATSDMHSFDAVRPTLQPFDRIYREAVFGQFRQAADRKELRAILASRGALPLLLYTGIFLLIGLPLLMIWAMLQFVPRWRRQWRFDRLAMLAFMLLTILFSTAVSNLLSTFENNRYRFPLDGYYTVIAALAITSLIRRRISPDPAPGRAWRF
jgi:Dolichyl-phosphate-mannose-protein mannosyltransferase